MRAGFLTYSSRTDQRKAFKLICHPDDPSIARGGRTSDSFAPAKPVPVSKSRSAPYAPTLHARLRILIGWQQPKTRTGGACASLSEILPSARIALFVRMTKKGDPIDAQQPNF
jgi:hypothetical protein